jgi:hypothetical protein
MLHLDSIKTELLCAGPVNPARDAFVDTWQTAVKYVPLAIGMHEVNILRLSSLLLIEVEHIENKRFLFHKIVV